MSILKLDSITKIYKTGDVKFEALSNVSVDFELGEFVSILGPSGSGKTTMLNIIGALDTANYGKMFYNNIDMTNYSTSDFNNYRNKNIGFIFQNYYLVPHLSVKENIALTLKFENVSKHERNRRIDEMLSKVGMLEYKHKRPNQLSGGQMQRVAIARALVSNPDIILADEPTGALDSKNSTQIMKLLKELATNKLVIMVTHNKVLANEYSTRIIETLDGKIVKDTILEEKSVEKTIITSKNKSVRMHFFTAIILSLLNLIKKKMRTIMTMLGGAIGIVGLGLVFSLSSGMDYFLSEASKRQIGNFPINITSQTVPKAAAGGTSFTIYYPNDDIIRVRQGESQTSTFNFIENEFIDYLKNLDSTKYKTINYNKSVNYRFVTINGTLNEDGPNSYRTVNSYFTEMFDDVEFIEDQYELIGEGKFPTNKNEAVLLIDNYNAISISYLTSLGIIASANEIDIENSFIDINKILGKEYKLITNDDYYYYDEINGVYKTNSMSNWNTLDNIFKSDNDYVKIVGVARVKRGASFAFVTSGLMYHYTLTDSIHANALNSQIVKSQLEHGMDKDVFTGSKYETVTTSSGTTTAEYTYQYNLWLIGYTLRTTSIRIYINSYEDKEVVWSYINAYETVNKEVNLRMTDNFKNQIEDFEAMLKLFTTVLVIIALVSVAVAAIMIGIITHISVLDRKKEIGLLRAIGARRVDIMFLFNAETVIIGIIGGIIGLCGVLALLGPINSFVTSQLATYEITFLRDTVVVVAKFNLITALSIVAGSTLMALIAGSIPAIIASFQNPVVALRSE